MTRVILQSLHDLYERLEKDASYQIAPDGESLQKISFRVVVKPNGVLDDIQDYRVDEDGRQRPRQILVLGQTKSSGSGINPCFLWDNTTYMLGVAPKDSKPERTQRCFEAFRDRHLAAEKQIGSGAFSAVCRFLERWDPDRRHEWPVLGEDLPGFGVFQIVGDQKYVHEHAAVRRWWDVQKVGDEPSSLAQCLITGREAPIAATHPMIRGMPGQTTGGAIVSFNEPAYESYGHSQSHNAPVSRAAAFRYATALNALLDGPQRKRHRIPLGGDTTVAFWTDKPNAVEDIAAQFFLYGSRTPAREEVQDEGVRQKLEIFMRVLRKGRGSFEELGRVDETGYYLLGLSANQARLSVRFWQRATLGELLDNLCAHHRDLAIDRPMKDGEPVGIEFPSLQDVLDQTCPRKQGKADREKIPPMLEGPVLRAILRGTEYPLGLLQAVLRRLRADADVSYLRAAVIKAVLNRNFRFGKLAGEITMGLDPTRHTVPYLLGRLFAVLESTQRSAIGDVGSSIRDKYYGSASANPRSVFPKMLRMFQHHLSKLRKERPGVHNMREKLAEEIMDPLGAFPAYLDLVAQGEFAIGYYHQRRDLFSRRRGAADGGEDETEPETGSGDSTAD